MSLCVTCTGLAKPVYTCYPRLMPDTMPRLISVAAQRHKGHDIHPHQHVTVPAAAEQVCSGRWWCEDCREWFSAPPCRGRVVPAFMKMTTGVSVAVCVSILIAVTLAGAS